MNTIGNDVELSKLNFKTEACTFYSLIQIKKRLNDASDFYLTVPYFREVLKIN